MVVDGIERAQWRVKRFEDRYGRGALQFARYAAFPLTLTADLSYCLREKFTPDLPWYVAADVLLSGLCQPIGYDLYEMDLSTQNYLRQQLVEECERQGNAEQQLDGMAEFLENYILYRLGQESGQRAKDLGYPPHWIALACLKPADEVTQIIQRELAEILTKTSNPSDRFRLATLVENLGDLLLQKGYEPIYLQDLRALQLQLESGEPIAPFEVWHKRLQEAGFPELKVQEIEYATFVFDESQPSRTDGTLTDFSFETVTVDARGEVVQREQHTAKSFIETLPEGLNLEMVAIPSGKFWMGSPNSETGRSDREEEQRQVTVAPFFLGKYPVTQAQWRKVASLPQEKRPLTLYSAYFRGSSLPVEQVSWLDAEEFCLRLSVATGRTYRLPSEAQWEYACRAGTNTPFYFGETIAGHLANYYSDTTYRQEKKVSYRACTTPVGQFPPNKFGLYDMHGNVWEWCQDHWHQNDRDAPINGSAWLTDDENHPRIMRGGSWYYNPGVCRSACRNHDRPDYRSDIIGFRVTCVAP